MDRFLGLPLAARSLVTFSLLLGWLVLIAALFGGLDRGEVAGGLRVAGSITAMLGVASLRVAPGRRVAVLGALAGGVLVWSVGISLLLGALDARAVVGAVGLAVILTVGLGLGWRYGTGPGRRTPSRS